MLWRSGLALIAGAVLATGPASLADRTGLHGYFGSYDWRYPDDRFGGVSGIEVTEDGLGFQAITDRGLLIEGRFTRGGYDRIAQVEVDRLARLALPDVVPDPEFRMDTEGLAAGRDGSIHVAFEWLSRVVRYADADAPPDRLPIPPAFADLDWNAGIEALAVDAKGHLWAIPEAPRDGAFDVHRFDGTQWTVPVRLTPVGGFVPVGADVGPDGRLYVLERQFHGPRGFASQVRRLNGEAGVAAGETVLQTPPGHFGNLEGIAVWRDRTGALRLTLVADDNFLRVLGTEIVEFRLPD